MNDINPELSAKIAREVKLKQVIDDAKDARERQRPITRAIIEEIEDTRRLNDSFNNYLEC